MRKFFLGAALVAASFGMAQSADAATVMGVEGVSTVLAISDYEGTYNGTMDKIKMKGKDYEPRAASYTLEGGLLTCDFPQIGSMPGTITIELNVNVDEETGEITADSGCVLLRKNYHNIFTSPNGEDTIILSARLLCR